MDTARPNRRRLSIRRHRQTQPRLAAQRNAPTHLALPAPRHPHHRRAAARNLDGIRNELDGRALRPHHRSLAALAPLPPVRLPRPNRLPPHNLAAIPPTRLVPPANDSRRAHILHPRLAAPPTQPQTPRAHAAAQRPYKCRNAAEQTPTAAAAQRPYKCRNAAKQTPHTAATQRSHGCRNAAEQTPTTAASQRPHKCRNAAEQTPSASPAHSAPNRAAHTLDDARRPSRRTPIRANPNHPAPAPLRLPRQCALERRRLPLRMARHALRKSRLHPIPRPLPQQRTQPPSSPGGILHPPASRAHGNPPRHDTDGRAYHRRRLSRARLPRPSPSRRFRRVQRPPQRPPNSPRRRPSRHQTLHSPQMVDTAPTPTPPHTPPLSNPT